MRSKFFTYLLPLFLLLAVCMPGAGQVSLNYSIGFTANLSINNVDIPTYSSPISITENNKCINLDNGLSKFMISQRGFFNLSCIVDTSMRVLNFSLYPNPSVSNFVTVRLTENSTLVTNLASKFLIKILGTGGGPAASRSASLAELKNGVQISVMGFKSGFYLIHISSEADNLSGIQKMIIIK